MVEAAVGEGRGVKVKLVGSVMGRGDIDRGGGLDWDGGLGQPKRLASGTMISGSWVRARCPVGPCWVVRA